MIRVFVGYDPNETVAFHVLSHSIVSRASAPVAITPLALSQLGVLLWRERDPLQSTDFSFSRFLVPHLCDYEGWAIYLDCDMLMLDDVAELWSLRDERYSVMVTKHDHRPREEVKFLGRKQTRYAKKNWSSMMLFHCGRCRALSPEYVNRATGLELHQFEWLAGDHLIGDIPLRWNHLVGAQPDLPLSEISNLHFTSGGPHFEQFAHVSYAREWFAERDRMLYANQERR